MTAEILRKLGIVSVIALMAGIAGCNTVEGVGEDIEAAGDAISDEARDR